MYHDEERSKALKSITGWLNSDASLASFIEAYAVMDIADASLIHLRVLGGYAFPGINYELFFHCWSTTLFTPLPQNHDIHTNNLFDPPRPSLPPRKQGAYSQRRFASPPPAHEIYVVSACRLSRPRPFMGECTKVDCVNPFLLIVQTDLWNPRWRRRDQTAGLRRTSSLRPCIPCELG